ncbi:MAG: FeoA family protein [Cyanobacteriota bacterium]|jgi:ferrous iron transport protein A|nr:FeoA family protein [Cyanobacteriota bacterium]
MAAPLRLVDLLPGHFATVERLSAEPGLRQRLEALGLRPGQSVQMLRRAWWSGPLHVRVGMTELMLRRRDAHGVTLAA